MRELLEIKPKDEKKKSTTSKAVRALTFINLKALNPMVGPGSYPAVVDPKDKKAKEPAIPERGIKYKDYKKLLKEKREKELEKIRAEKNRIEEVTSKIKGEVPKFPVPLPTDIDTFDRYRKKYGSDKDRQKAKSSKVKGSSLCNFRKRIRFRPAIRPR